MYQKTLKMQPSSSNHMQLFIELFKLYLAFVNFIDLVAPVRQRIPREHFSHSEREMHSLYKELMAMVQQGNDREFRKFTRISVSSFKRLLHLLKENLQKYSQRHPIPPECRLLLTLTYLAYNSPRNRLTMAFRLGLTTLRNVIIDTVETINSELAASYLRQFTEDEYLQQTEDMRSLCGLPNCVGSLDAVEIKPEIRQCSYVLVACSNTKYQLFNADVAMADDMPNRDNIVNHLREANVPDIPGDIQTTDTGIIIPSYFVTSNRFPFVKHTMRPYPGKNLVQDRQYLNDCLRICSDTTDNAFGLLFFKWRILQSKIGGLSHVAQNIIRSCVILHNFAIQHDRKYLHSQLVDHTDKETTEFKAGIWRQILVLPKSKCFNINNTATSEAFEMRELVKNYLYSESVNRADDM